jgi:hypothetical protein
MKKTLNEPEQYLTRFGSQCIPGNLYALKKLGLDSASCFLKIENYTLPCLPFNLGLKRSVLLTALSRNEIIFFQRYVHSPVVFCIALNPEHRPEPVNFFLRCSLNTIGQMKNRENVALFVVDYKVFPDEMINMLGKFLEDEERSKTGFDFESINDPVLNNTLGRKKLQNL